MLTELKNEIAKEAEAAEQVAMQLSDENKIIYETEAKTLRHVLELLDSDKYSSSIIAVLKLTKEWNKEILEARAKAQELISRNHNYKKAEELGSFAAELYYRREQLLNAITVGKDEPKKLSLDRA